MKKLILAAAMAAVSAPAYAADYTMAPAATTSGNACSGHVEAYAGDTHLTGNGGGGDAWAYGGAARANCNFNARWNAQGDLMLDGLESQSGGGGGFNSYGGAVHVYWRDPSAYALGGFASLEGFGGSSGLNDVYRYLIGPEGQVYMGNVTLYGQTYYGQLTDGNSGYDIWGARGVVRYFARENMRFDGELGYRNMSVSGGDLDVFTAAAEADYRFDNSPVSIFGRYQFDHLTPNGGGSNLNLHKFVVGARLSFGSKTLLDEDRNGATMDTIQPNYIIY